MGTIQVIIDKVFLLACMILAGYMTCLQFQYYLRNQDLSSISYRKFNSEPQDQYPIFTICYSGYPEGEIFSDSLILPQYGIDPRLYGLFLRGKLNEQEYQDNINSFARINYDEVVSDVLKSIPIRFWAMSKENKVLSHWNRSLSQTPPLVVSHQTPRRVCFSKKRRYRKNVALRYDELKLDSKALQQKGLSFHLYIHQDGQLIRHFSEPIFSLSNKYIKKLSAEYNGKFVHLITIRITEVALLRKR